MRPDIIKIDRSLVNGVSTDAGRQSVATVFAALAADLRATLVAEGVESRYDLAALRDLGVQAAQGYLLARPTTDLASLSGWVGTGTRSALSQRGVKTGAA